MEESRECEGRPTTRPAPLASGHGGGGGAGRTAAIDHNIHGHGHEMPMTFDYHPMSLIASGQVMNNVEKIKIQPYYVPALPMIITDEDIKSNDDLREYLMNRGDIYESTIGYEKRQNVIAKLHQIVVDWAISVGKTKNISDDGCSNGGGIRLKIFGSTRLDVHSPDADIDLLCIAPTFVTRSDFFTSFTTLMSSRDDVSMLSGIPEAYTPVIKFNIDGLSIDMIFVSIDHSPIPDNFDVLDNRNLMQLDEQGVRSLNGVRVAECLRLLVPNFDNFCTALRFVKFWAKQRGIYSNVLGFLGGVNYAILVAYICQRFPTASPSIIIKRFFQIFSIWQWPMPVLLTAIDQDNENSLRKFPIWNPELNIKDAQHIMPIITPAYPAMNSAYNVGLPQFRLLRNEFIRGYAIIQNKYNKSDLWTELCTGISATFFSAYPYYVQVDISSISPVDQRHWFGWVESRLRLLILALDNEPMGYFCHPQANCFHRMLADSNDETSKNSITHRFMSSFFIGMAFHRTYHKFSLPPLTSEFMFKVNHWDGKKNGMEITLTLLTNHIVPQFVHNIKAEPSSVSGCTPIGKHRSNINLANQPAKSAQCNKAGGSLSVGISTGIKDMGINSCDKSNTNDQDSNTEHMIDRLVDSNLAHAVSPPTIPVTSLVTDTEDELPLCIDVSRKALFPLTEDVIQQRNNQVTNPTEPAHANDTTKPSMIPGRNTYLKTLVGGTDITSPTKKQRNF